MQVNDAGGTSGVTFINRFTVHGSPAEFERVFADTSAFMSRQDGFVAHTLLRHLQEPASYVNIAHWRDVPSFQRAVAQPAFQPHAAAIRALSTSEPNLYAPRWSVSAETASGQIHRDVA
jgi:monooxygenase